MPSTRVEDFCMCVTHYVLTYYFVSLISGYLLTQENISGVLTEVPPLISESDLHISQVHTRYTGAWSCIIITCIYRFAYFAEKHAPLEPPTQTFLGLSRVRRNA